MSINQAFSNHHQILIVNEGDGDSQNWKKKQYWLSNSQ